MHGRSVTTNYIKPMIAIEDSKGITHTVTIEKGRCYIATDAKSGVSWHGKDEAEAVAGCRRMIELDYEIGKRK